MSEEEKSASPDTAGCLPLLISVALAALLLTLTVFPPPFATWQIYIPVFMVTGLIAALLGMPLYLVAAHFERKDIWTALGAGALTGGASLPLIGLLMNAKPVHWSSVAGFAVVGAVGGLAFYLTATVRRAPRRNAALLFALIGISITGASLAMPWLNPPALSSAAR